MVDALYESGRVLHDRGVLVDFRPLVLSPPIEIVSRESTQEIGSVDDSAATGDSAAADAAIRTVVGCGIFRPLTNNRFEIAHYWDSVEEMSEYLASRRHRMSIRPSERQVRKVFDRTVRANSSTRLRCRWQCQLNAYIHNGIYRE